MKNFSLSMSTCYFICPNDISCLIILLSPTTVKLYLLQVVSKQMGYSYLIPQQTIMDVIGGIILVVLPLSILGLGSKVESHSSERIVFLTLNRRPRIRLPNRKQILTYRSMTKVGKTRPHVTQRRSKRQIKKKQKTMFRPSTLVLYLFESTMSTSSDPITKLYQLQLIFVHLQP